MIKLHVQSPMPIKNSCFVFVVVCLFVVVVVVVVVVCVCVFTRIFSEKEKDEGA